MPAPTGDDGGVFSGPQHALEFLGPSVLCLLAVVSESLQQTCPAEDIVHREVTPAPETPAGPTDYFCQYCSLDVCPGRFCCGPTEPEHDHLPLNINHTRRVVEEEQCDDCELITELD